MITLKFGGTSMGSACRILDSADIMISRAKDSRISVVVSAVAGVSNKLQSAIDSCVAGGQPAEFVEEIRGIHQTICSEIQGILPEFNLDAVRASIDKRLAKLEKLLSALVTLGECSASAHCRIMGMGEQMSSPIVEEVLRAKKQSVVLLDSRKFIYTTGDQKEGDPDYIRSADAFSAYRDNTGGSARILLFPGFICTWTGGTGSTDQPGLLGRNGSDFSAAIIGSCLGAGKVEFWTDVEGIYTADPRIVRDAVLVKDMSYEEAMELSFFGSRVLHPKTLAPLAAKGIEAWSLDSFNPKARGTRIGRGPFESEKKAGPVRGISCLKDCAMISVSGPGMKGKKGMAGRIFAATGSAGISVLLITQSSSEYTISFCVRKSDAARIQDVLKAEFSLEIATKLLDKISVHDNCAIVSIVGDAMREKRGVAGTFFDSLASKDINILAIAQGSSERSIAAVINACDGDTAVRVVHQFFFNTTQSIQVFAFGCGTIGGTLLDQIADQQAALREQGIDIQVMAIAKAQKMLFNSDGLNLKSWREDIASKGEQTDLEDILDYVRNTRPLNPVFVDCTASYNLPERYLEIFKAGMSVATPNKRANSMGMDYYEQLRETANAMHVRFLYETNVGAGLPIIDTLQNLFKSGDRLTGFNGIMSGSLSYIFGRLDEGVSFSKAVLEAKDKKFTEPDPRDDLKGTDVARKALIIAREAGMSLELADIQMNSIFPEGFDIEGTTEEFIARLPELDSYFADKIAALKKEGKVLRMGASIQNGKVSVGMLAVGPDDPLYAVKGGENAFVFHTNRYNPIPLTIRGYGAGAGVTAAGVFGDILRTVSWNVSSF